MDFALSDEQVMIRDSFRGLLSRDVSLDLIRDVAAVESACDAGLWSLLTEMGMPGLLIAEEFGGAGLGLLEATVVAEELARAMAPVPYVGSAVLAPLALMGGENDALKSAWLPRMAAGEVRLGVALTELAAGVRKGMGVTATDTTLSGQTRFVLEAGEAAAMIVGDRSGGLYLVEADAAGVETTAFPTIDGTRCVVDLQLDNVPATLVAGGNSGVAARIIDAGRIILAAETLGAGEEMLRRAVTYAGERKQFDRIIGSFQAVKHMCAEMAAELEPCRGLVWHAAYAFDHLPDETREAAAMTKSHVDEVGRFVARTATEVHGGMGFTDLMGLHYWYKRIGFNRAALGTPDRLRDELAARLLGRSA